MFRHNKPRSFLHNLRLASLLSFIAGIVNVNGLLSVQTLTTNVTGHFAFFSERFSEANYDGAIVFIVYVLFFLLGAFICGLLVEFVMRRRPAASHAAPMFLEMTILILVALSWKSEPGLAMPKEWIGCALLFAMGLQNALVTRISRATVRTTHLTGLFTDLGIELSQLFFYRSPGDTRKLTRSIHLRVVIIICFFLGGVLGGILFLQFNLRTLFFAAAGIVIALVYDNILYGIRVSWRKLRAGTIKSYTRYTRKINRVD